MGGAGQACRLLAEESKRQNNLLFLELVAGLELVAVAAAAAAAVFRLLLAILLLYTAS